MVQMGKNRDLLQCGNEFWRLIENEHEKARRYCFKLTGGDENGDDLYQDAVIKAYNGFADLRNIESFRPWLYRIINNAYKARFRNRWWQKVKIQPLIILDSLTSVNPSDSYEARRRLDFALDCLSTDDRIIVTMAELEGWKITELAELFSKTEGFIKMRLSRARRKMRKKLSGLYSEKSGAEFKEESKVYAVLPSSKKIE